MASTGRPTLLRRAKTVPEAGSVTDSSAEMGAPRGMRVLRVAPLLCASVVLLLTVPSLLVPREPQTSLTSEEARPVWMLTASAAYIPCTRPSAPHPPPASPPTGYLVIEASGGLNQERTGISDAVVVARLLNATLVVPLLDTHSVWGDPSSFADVFDQPHFIRHLAPDVAILPALPPSVAARAQETSRRVPRKSSPAYYHAHILPLLLQKRVVRLTKFDFRLPASLPLPLQKLRCRALYEALLFTPAIRAAGDAVVQKLRANTGGVYVAVHLRFEEDMLAFSGCEYGGGEEERARFSAIRQRWPNLKGVDGEEERRKGKCPLTPTEVGRVLRALGYPPTTHLYVASGALYGGSEALKGLLSLYPLLHTKESLGMGMGVGVGNFSSRRAAVDYLVCQESDVLIANNRGNMARLLAGHRRFLGHRVTIRPNLRKLGALLMTAANRTKTEVEAGIRAAQHGFRGEAMEPAAKGGGFYENPRACICGDRGRGDHLPSDEYGERRR